MAERRNLNLDVGLLLLRVGISLSMAIFHGWGKISGGPERWRALGESMQNLGIDFLPTWWGFMAGFSEFFGSLLLIVGLFSRQAAALLAATMTVAAIRHLSLPADAAGAGWSGASHALELLVVYVTVMLTGPGRLSLDWRLRKKK